MRVARCSVILGVVLVFVFVSALCCFAHNTQAEASDTNVESHVLPENFTICYGNRRI